MSTGFLLLGKKCSLGPSQQGSGLTRVRVMGLRSVRQHI